MGNKHNRFCLCDKCVDKSSSPRADEVESVDPRENAVATASAAIRMQRAGRVPREMVTPKINRNLVFPEEKLTNELREADEKIRVLENQLHQMRNCGNCESSIAACRERRVPGGLSRYEECTKHDRIHWVWDGKQQYRSVKG